MKKADLHIHTIYSDGKLNVAKVIKLAEEKGLDYISITDHDTFRGSLEAFYEQANYSNINFIIGIELSTENLDESVHVLGYFKNANNLEEFEKYLAEQRKNRLNRAIRIKEALLKYFKIDLNLDFTNSLLSVTRGSIANEIIAQGFPYTREEIFGKMIGRGCPAYFPSTKLFTELGIKLIHEYNGLAVLAHPCLLKINKPADLLKFGFDGIEAIYPSNKDHEQAYFKNLARKFNIFITAGNDFHEFNDNKHGLIGKLVLEKTDLDIFIKKLGEK